MSFAMRQSSEPYLGKWGNRLGHFIKSIGKLSNLWGPERLRPIFQFETDNPRKLASISGD